VPSPDGSVRIRFAKPPHTMILPQIPSADGGRYARPGTEFWIKGRTARLTRGTIVTECRVRQ
jgi:membrane-bound inhibitor of C-type lysozyme